MSAGSIPTDQTVISEDITLCSNGVRLSWVFVPSISISIGRNSLPFLREDVLRETNRYPGTGINNDRTNCIEIERYAPQ